jgi:Ca-activated chloride channel family protein
MKEMIWKWMFYGLISMSLTACGMDEMGGMHYEPNKSQNTPPQYNISYDAVSGADAGSAADSISVEPEELGPDGKPISNASKFEAPGTNPYVIAAGDPQSTFAVDVDTASYDIFRQYIEMNMLPSKDSVRLEEYVNYFPYDYPQPAHDSPTPFAIAVDAAPNPFTPETTLLSIGIKAREAGPDTKKPANLVFLVDVSGSMSNNNKLPLVKKVLTESLEVLEATDTVSIVAYSGHVAVKLGPTPVSKKKTIKEKINALSASGSTAGGQALQLAYTQAANGFIDGGINHILLCTDGDFNVGISGTDALVSFIEEKRKTGITLTALGFGTNNLNDAMMEAVTNAGNGIYAVIANEDQAIAYVNKRLLSTMTHVAKDVKFQIEFNPEQVYAYRLLGYENRALEDHQFLDDKVDAGEVGTGHTVTALYELVLAGGELPTVEGAPEPLNNSELSDVVLDVKPDELCLVKIRYKHVEATEDDEAFQVERGLSASMIHPTLGDASGDLQWAAAVAAFSEILKESPYGNIDYENTITELIEANAGDDGDRLEFHSLMTTAFQMLKTTN